MANNLQWKKMTWSSEMTDQNSLAQALLTEPEIANTLAYAFGDKFHLQYLTQGSGRVSEKYKILGNEEFMWALQGKLHKAITITGAVSPATNIGLNHAPFTIPLAEKYFALGDILRFDQGAQARVQSEPDQSGTDFIYTLQLVTNDPNAIVPTEDAGTGRELSFEYTAFEEYSEGGSSKQAFPMWFKNQMTTSRLSWSMSGSARTDVIVLEVRKQGGGKSMLWMYEEQYQQMLSWMKQTERNRWYGLYNRDDSGVIRLPGANGRPVKTGAGVLDQIAFFTSRSFSFCSLVTSICFSFKRMPSSYIYKIPSYRFRLLQSRKSFLSY